jgi:hypothetical protein
MSRLGKIGNVWAQMAQTCLNGNVWEKTGTFGKKRERLGTNILQHANYQMIELLQITMITYLVGINHPYFKELPFRRKYKVESRKLLCVSLPTAFCLLPIISS